MRAATLLSLRPLFLDRSTIPDIFCGQYEEALSLVVRSVAFAGFGFDANSRLCNFSASDFDLPHVGWQYGPTFGIYHDAWHLPFAGVGVDGRASLIGSGSTKVYSGLVGPRAQVRPHVVPFQPYVEALIGGGNVQVGQGVARTDKNVFEYQVVAGGDLTVLPHIDWRVAEFSYSGFSGMDQSFHPRTFSTGIVLRLP